MNKKGKIITEILVMLIVIVITSAIIFSLVRFGVVSVRAENEQVPILNAEFIPFVREGYLAINEFYFCSFIDEKYQCLNPKEEFNLGEKVYFLFAVESSTSNGEVMLVENYRILGPSGEVLLDVDQKNDYNFDLNSNHDTELINFKDYFTLGENDPIGQYTIELLLKNPLLDKTTTLVKKIDVK